VPPHVVSALRLLVCGDLHVGRRPSRIPSEAPGLDGATVLRAAVDAAVERRVDAVLLAGDLADASNRFYEAFGLLETQLRRLADAGIPALLVGGADDHDVAGPLADAVGSPLVRAVGRGGTWEAVALPLDGPPAAQVVGWSRPARASASPLDAFPDAGDAPVVGLLHADDATDEALAATPAVVWIVGGDHTPSVTGDAPLVVRPGSLQPLAPDDTDDHGAWLVTLDASGARAAPVPLATLRYTVLDVDLSDAATPEAARAAVLDALRALASSVRDESPTVRHLAVSVCLAGRSASARHAATIVADLAGEEVERDGLTARVAHVTDDLRPALDLDRLADGSGPAAALARLARRLDAGTLTDADRALVARAEAAVRDARRARVFDPLAERLDGDASDEARRRLHRQTLRLLDAVAAR